MDRVTELANRIYELQAPWEREYTPEEIAKELQNDPLSAVEYLLDIINES